MNKLRALAGDSRSEFHFALVPYGRPQLWIGGAARLEACDERGTFRFSINTCHGWQVLLESDQFALISDAAARYVRARCVGCAALESLLQTPNNA